jgi:hypothetical protein
MSEQGDDPGPNPEAPAPADTDPDVPARAKRERAEPSLAVKTRLERLRAYRMNRPRRTLVGRPEGQSIAALMRVPAAKLKVKTKGSLSLTNRTARELVASYTNGGEEVVRFMLNAMQGQVQGVGGRARIAAAEWLGLYVFGKPVETTVQLSMNQQGSSLPNLDDATLEEFARGLVSGNQAQVVVEPTDQPPALPQDTEAVREEEQFQEGLEELVAEDEDEQS